MPKTIEYESDTSNESDNDIWEDDWPEEDQVEEDELRVHIRQKRRKLDVPVLKAHTAAHKKKCSILKLVLVNIQKLIQLRRTNFKGGAQGLQSYCAQAIKSYLCLVVNGNQNSIPASETAAESLGFARTWGGQQLNKWAMNPQKLKDFTNQKLLPAEAAKYCQEICNKEMPQGLKK
ncbi:hypothetical protein PILCRDRAFT_93602 [Piloderma croceum F 1598]|uniref:Uncharacterized protein n=1 Tax=Piloderma croceum (strain F 1598) TaxID=765440 RepID=A0A0C3AE67_PILCF|nr:hypothetical protein PILCRDRAFT_93602 [Piloderma croceum F 1598]